MKREREGRDEKKGSAELTYEVIRMASKLVQFGLFSTREEIKRESEYFKLIRYLFEILENESRKELIYVPLMRSNTMRHSGRGGKERE